jgi:hypothetical protein
LSVRVSADIKVQSTILNSILLIFLSRFYAKLEITLVSRSKTPKKKFKIFRTLSVQQQLPRKQTNTDLNEQEQKLVSVQSGYSHIQFLSFFRFSKIATAVILKVLAFKEM